MDTRRKRKKCLLTIVNAILIITRSGAQWRNMDEKYPPWQSVYYYFRKWQKDGTWSSILSYLVEKERVSQNRNAKASISAVDNQSVKIGSFISIKTGIDGGKKVNGLKRHLIIEILGLPLAMHVSAANIHDGKGGVELLWPLEKHLIGWKKFVAMDIMEAIFQNVPNIKIGQWKSKKSLKVKKGFVHQTGCCQVERSFV